ncbi:MAG: Nif11-like leader peptide family natural product precursor [Nostoc sp.]|uniref:Nif11-like leader peptide family natural product precursor n=1 Tax=Nostoc sp. TaxID=1180 RepID=UPI002FF9C32A
MSNQSVYSFFSQVEQDSTLKQQVKATTNKDDLLRIAQESGYNFTAEDIKAFVEKNESDELDEEELEAVAGGGIKQIWREVKNTASDVWDAIVG